MDGINAPETIAHAFGDRSEPLLEHTVGDALRHSAAQWGSRPALVDGSGLKAQRRRWSFADLLRDAEQVAHALRRHFREGEHVAVWAPNSPEWILLEFGAALAGLTLVTVNPAYQASELTYVLGQSEAVGLFVVPEFRGRDMIAVVDEVKPRLSHLRRIISLADWRDFIAAPAKPLDLPSVKPDDTAQIQYTSGTTGFPKGAMLSHRGLVNNARTFAHILGATPDDVLVNPMPLFHTAGCGLVTLGALQAGATQVLAPGFDPADTLQLIEAERGTMMLGVPTMLIAMLEHPDFAMRDKSSVRLVASGGAPVSLELVRRVERELGVAVAIGYGQTEASPYITHTVPGGDSTPDWASTVGRPLPWVEVKIADPRSGLTVVRGKSGEICTRGYAVMKGYFNNSAATVSAIDGDGWLHTGDLGSMDAAGYCRILGRLKDMIIRGGENIYPREIEELLCRYPGIIDVAVVGVPDEVWGEIPAAVIRCAGEVRPSEDALFDFCRQHLAPYKTPRLWRFVDQFPQTPSGKVQKFVLRDQFRPERRDPTLLRG
jgi:fatty-acyl-CoA synthase